MLLIRISLSVAVLGVFYSTGSCNKSNFTVGLNSDSGFVHDERKGQDSIFNAFFLNSKPESKHKSEVHNGAQSNKTNLNSTATGRQYFITGATGWGWPGYTSGNLDLYSLLGGLAFLGLLASLFMYLANRVTTTTVTVINGSGRRRRDLHDSDEDPVGETISEFLSKMGLTFSRPWWDEVKAVNKQKVVPFNLY